MKPITVLLGLSLLLAGSAFAGKSQTEAHQINFKSGGKISLTNSNGYIRISSWDRDQVEVTITKEFNGWSRKALQKLEKVEIDINDQPGNLTIETYHPQKVNMWGSVTVNYELKVPRKVALKVRNANGPIFIEGVEGLVAARTTNGSVVLEGMRGSFDAKTTNGKIQAELVAHAHGEEVRCSTTNGAIRLKLPQSIQADLRADVTNGSINTSIPLSVEGKIKRKRVRGAINGGGAVIDLHTTNGSISIDEAG